MKTIFALALLLCSQCLGNYDCDWDCVSQETEHCCYAPSCSSCCEPVVFGLGGEWLYLRPSASGLEYTQVINLTPFNPSSTPNTFINELKCICPKSTSGYRIFAFFQSCELDCQYKVDIEGAYTSFKSSTSAQTQVEPTLILSLVNGFVADEDSNQYLTATASVDFNYRAWDAEIGWSFFNRSAAHLRVFTGVRQARITETLRTDYTDPAPSAPDDIFFANIENDVKMSGVGPKFGIEVFWDSLCFFGVEGKASTNLLVTKKTGSFFQQSFDAPTDPSVFRDFQLDETYCSKTQVIPNLELRLGLKLLCPSFYCFTFSASGGYQVSQYFNAFEILSISGNNLPGQDETGERFIDSTIRTLREDFGLDGWYLNASLSF